MERPFLKLLDRELAREHMRQEHGDTLDLMEEVVNYGSNLVPRCLESSRKDTVAAITIGVLLRHGVAMLDATTALSREGSVLCAWATTRSLIEAWISAAFVLQEDSLNRVRHYYAWNLRQERRWARRVLEGSKESLAFEHVWDGFEGLSDFDEPTTADARERDRKITEMLARPDYQPIEQAFEKRARPGYDG